MRYLGSAWLLDRSGVEIPVENHPSSLIGDEVANLIDQCGSPSEQKIARDYLNTKRDELKEKLNYIYNENWCKVRVWGNFSEEVTFRITSTGFNWYSIIIEFLIRHPGLNRSLVTVEADSRIKSKHIYWDSMSVEDILNPANEQILSSKFKGECDMKTYMSKRIRSAEENSSKAEIAVEFVEQEFGSAATSINSTRLPAIFKLIDLKSGTVNADIGGGKFDNVAEYYASKDVTNLVYDPYNRSAEHNKQVVETLKEVGGADTTTCSNVLNVISEKPARLAVIKNCKNFLKSGGTAYFTVYEGNRSGEGKADPKRSSFQMNQPTEWYVDEISEVFSSVTRKGKLIIAN